MMRSDRSNNDDDIAVVSVSVVTTVI
jgi:hypothetical protein